MLALEPRYLYDAAGLVTLVDSADSDSGTAADGHGTAASVDTGGHDSDTGLEAVADLVPPAAGAAATEATEADTLHPEAADPAPEASSSIGESRSIIFVDDGIEDLQTLINGLDPDAEVVLLDQTQDGVAQITEALSGRQGIDAVYIYSHGGTAQAFLGSASLSLDTIDAYSSQLSAWGDALSADGDILFYGCRIGDGDSGTALVDQISELTRADVAASSDNTGAADLGGDWDLEVESGTIEAAMPLSRDAQDAYDGLLAAPAAPSTPDLDAGSDSGSSNSDNITNDTTPTFTGTAEANSTVTLYDGATSLGTATADGSGNWSFTSAALTEGDHVITATAANGDGTSAASSGLTVTIDTTAPGIQSTLDLSATSDTGISDTDNITNKTTASVHGNASERGVVTFYRNGSSIGTANPSGSTGYVINIPLAVGTNSLTTTLTDVAGNESAQSAPLVVTVDTSAPAAVPGTPDLTAASDTGSSNTDNITNDTTPTFTGTAASGDIIGVYDGATLLGTATAGLSGDWQFTPSAALSEGSHSITARTMDTAGNTSADSSALTITIDTTAPAISTPDLSAASDTGKADTDNITSDTTPSFTGTAQANAQVSIYDGAALLGTVTADGIGNWGYTASTLSEGSHSITARATDTAGNTAPSSALSLTIDTTSPAKPSAPDLSAASDSGASDTDNITNDFTPTFTGTAEANAKVEIYEGAILLGSTTADGSGNWTYTGNFNYLGTDAANVNVKVRAIDAAGNVSAFSPSLALKLDGREAAVPSAANLATTSDTGSSDTDNLTSDTTPTFTGTASANLEVLIYDGTSLAGATLLGSTTADGSGNWTFTAGVLSDGTHNIFTRSRDVAGNLSGPSSTLVVTVDATAPATPAAPDLTAASDSGSSSTDNITSDTTPTLTGTAEANAEVRVYDGATLLGTTTADGSGAWSFTPGALADGARTITATATDTAGNVSVASSGLSLTIDTAAPAVPGAPDLVASSDTGSSSTDNITSDTTPTLTGTAEANAQVSVYDGATLLGTTAANGSGAWHLTPGALAEGAHTITVRATDAAGNTSSASSGLMVTIDTTAPAAPGVPDLTAASDTGSSDSDNLTNDDTPTLTGTAEANAQVSVYDGATLLGTTAADGSGAWRLTPGALAEGTHTITATATDAAGNTSTASSGLTVTIDTTAPAVTDGNISISGATGIGGAYKVGDTVTATWDNSGSGDNNNDVASVTMDFSEFGGPSAVTATLSSGVWQASFAVTEGGGGIVEADNRNVLVKATDTAGNSRTVQDGANVTVDNTSPGAPAGSLDVDEQSADRTVVGTVSATGGSTYTLLDDAGGRFVIDTATGRVSVANGRLLDFENEESHTIAVRATDAAGNSTDASLVIAINDVFDDPAQNAAPTGTAAGQTGNAGDGTGPGTSVPGAGNSPWAPSGTLPGPLSEPGNDGAFQAGVPGPAEGFEASEPGEGNGIPDVSVAPGHTLEFGFPENAFAADIPNSGFTYEVSLANGSDLPDWISFDPATRVFTISPGEQVSEGLDLDILVIARSQDGLEIRTTFEVSVDAEGAVQQVQVSLNDSAPEQDPAPLVAEPHDQDAILAALTSGMIPAAGFAGIGLGRPGLSAQIRQAAGQFDREREALINV